MSSTKIVIIVLVVVGLLFVIFVTRGALRNEPREDSDSIAKKEKPGWTKTIKGLFSSLQPKVELKQKEFFRHTVDTIKPDEKQPFRTVTFVWLSGSPSITYDNKFPPLPGEPANLQHQTCLLPNPRGDDPSQCSIVALKRGGTLTFDCLLNAPCGAKVK